MLYTTRGKLQMHDACFPAYSNLTACLAAHSIKVDDDTPIPLSFGIEHEFPVLDTVWALRTVSEGPVASVSVALAERCCTLVTEQNAWGGAALFDSSQFGGTSCQSRAHTAARNAREATSDYNAAVAAYGCLHYCMKAAPQLEAQYRQILLQCLAEG